MFNVERVKQREKKTPTKAICCEAASRCLRSKKKKICFHSVAFFSRKGGGGDNELLKNAIIRDLNSIQLLLLLNEPNNSCREFVFDEKHTHKQILVINEV